jgi:hypothetical protein
MESMPGYEEGRRLGQTRADAEQVDHGTAGKATLVDGGFEANAAAPAADPKLATAATNAIGATSSSHGQALPAHLARKFESSLGSSLTEVRVHTGPQSAAATRAVGAKAYALGQDIHFGRGQYDPDSPAGERLLAHEVAHTAQQRGSAAVPRLQLGLSSRGDATEVEADTAADAMIAGQSAKVSSAGGLARTIMREEGGEGEGGSPISGSFKAGIESDGKVCLSGSVTLTSPPAKGAVFSGHIIVGATISGEAETIEGGGGEGEGGKDAPKPEDGSKTGAGIELGTKAKEASVKCAQELAKDHSDKNSEIDTIEFEEEASTGKEKKETESKLGGKIVVKFKGGLKSYIDCNLIAIKDNKESVVPFDIEILKTTIIPIDVTVPIKTWVVDKMKISASFQLKVGGDIEPDKKRLAIWLAGKVGPSLLERLGIGASAGTMLRAIGGIMASAEANIGIFAAYITVKATLATLQKGDDMNATYAQAMDACYGYKSGFKRAVTGVASGSGDPAWVNQGVTDGTRALQRQITEVQQKFSAWNFQPDEIKTAMQEAFGKDAEMQRQLGLMIENNAWWAIKADYIDAWRKKRGFFEKIFTNTDSDEDMLAVKLGFPGKNEVPPPTDGPVSAEAGAAKQ